jgi:uncharacterized protein YndB with AHSA1/START domain
VPDIKHLIGIKAPAEVIYGLIASKAGLGQWLTKEAGWTITGEEDLGGTLYFYLGSSAHHEMTIETLERNKEVQWKCAVGHPQWIGTTVDFTIEDKGDERILHFSHRGWTEKTEWFEQCNVAWAGCLASIKKAAEGNEG